jgi:uncharacterized protein with HEPN domain
MPRRDWTLLLDDMLQSIEKIERYIEGYESDSFAADSRTVDAVVRNLEVIGEAANALPPEIRTLAPEVDWRGIVGLRNRVVHEYFGVSSRMIWTIASQELMPLKVALLVLLPRLR